jgi:hypothetical protein
MSIAFGILLSEGHGAQTNFTYFYIGIWQRSVFHFIKNLLNFKTSHLKKKKRS